MPKLGRFRLEPQASRVLSEYSRSRMSRNCRVLRLSCESAKDQRKMKGADEMKYILMMNCNRANWDQYAKWSKEDLQRNVAFMRAFNKELKDSGVLVATEGLALPHEAKIVRAGKDEEPITDGVFPESKEFLAGYWIIDVESAEQAYRIAARASAAPGPGGARGSMPIEVRRVLGSVSDL
jgi:hypothetical protein